MAEAGAPVAGRPGVSSQEKWVLTHMDGTMPHPGSSDGVRPSPILGDMFFS